MIQAVSGGGGGGGATDPFYAYRSLILNMQGASGSTTFTDSSPNNFTITPYGNAQIVSDNTFGSAMSLDGNGDYLSIPSNAAFAFGTGDFTVEAWVNPAAYNTANAIFDSLPLGGIGSRSNAIFIFLRSNGTLALFNNGSFTDSSQVVPLNQFSHVAVVYQSGLIRFYVNGIAAGTATRSWNLTSTAANIGVTADINTNPIGHFNGLIGPLRVSTWAVYTSNFTPSQDLFPAVQGTPAQDPYYDNNSLLLNMQGTAGGTTFIDESPNAFTVTRNGDTVLVSDATYGTVASFDGAGDYLSIPSNAAFNFGAGDFTVEFWYYPFASLLNAGLVDLRSSAASSTGLLLRQGDNSTNGLSLTCWAGTPGGTTPATQTGLNLNSWNHIAAVRNSNYLTVYINGVGGSSVLRSINLTDQNFRFGAFVNATGSPNCANGLIGPLRITKGVARYTSNFTPPTGIFPTS